MSKTLLNMLIINQNQITSFENNARRRLAYSVFDNIKQNNPHAVLGLSGQEVDERLAQAVEKSKLYQFDGASDIKTFISLCLLIGPAFDEYPRFKDILISDKFAKNLRLIHIFRTSEDWGQIAQYDVSYRYSQCKRVKQSVIEFSLTPLQLLHSHSYYELALHPDVWRLGKQRPILNLKEVQLFISELSANNKIGYAITDVNNIFLGAIIASFNQDYTDIHYWLGRPYWGFGICRGALSKFVRILQSERKTTFRLIIDSENLPSISVAKACGFSQIGTNEFSNLIFIR